MGTATGSITFSTALDNTQLEKDLGKLRNKINGVEKSIAQMENRRLGLADDATRAAAALDEAKARLAEMKAAARGTFAPDEIKEQNERVRLLQADYNRVDNTIQRIEEKLRTANLDLSAMKTEAGGMELELAQADGRAEQLAPALRDAASGAGLISPAMESANTSLDKFVTRIKGLAKRVFIFSLVTMALRSMRTWLGNVVKSNKEASKAVAKLKGALLTLAQPLVEVVIPAFTKLVNILTSIVTVLANTVSAIFGTTAQKSAEAAEALQNETDALTDTGNAAKKAGKSLASFDEINQLSDDSSDSSSTSDTIKPDFSGVISDGTDAVLTLLTGAALLAVGMILTFTGAHVLVGITMMALGAAAVYAAAQMNSEELNELLEGINWDIVAIVGMVAIVIGILVLCTGHIGVGLGLIAAGAAAIFTAYSFNPDKLKELFSNEIFLGCLAIVGVVAIALGLILIFAGQIGLGIGGIVLGATALFTAYNIDPSKFKEILSSEQFMTALVVGGALAVALGILLICVGQVALGIGGIVLGAAALFAAYSLDPQKFKEIISSEQFITDLVLGGAIGVALGIILICAGQTALGVGAIVAGAVALFAAYNLNPEAVKEIVAGPIGTAITVAGMVAIALGVILICAGQTAFGVGGIVLGAATLFAEYTIDPQKIVSVLQGPIGELVTLISGVLLYIGVALLIAGQYALGIGMIVLGAAGVVTEVAANWNALVSALQSPVAALIALISSALLFIGVALLFAGQFGLGIGMIVAGSAGLITSIAPDWGAITDKISSIGDSIMGIFQNMRDFVPGIIDKTIQELMDFADRVLSVFTDISGGIKNVVNGIIVIFEGLVNGIINAINVIIDALDTLSFDIPDWVPGIGGSTFGFNIPQVSTISLPRLAAGAVIPPNREFMAVLGDQQRGMNVEAPADLIKQMVKEALTETGGTGGTITLRVVPMAGFTRYMKFELDKENTVDGVSLVQGVV